LHRIGLIALTVLVACGDDSSVTSETSETEGTTSEDTTTTPTSASTSGTPSTSSTSLPGTETSEESSSSSAESSTTMPPGPACGDGNMDPGEECDDGNVDQDDACTAMCTVPYEIEWTVSYNGPASNMDDAEAVIFDGEGNILVVGSHRTLADGFDVWLQQFAPDGTELWNFTWDGGTAVDESAAGIALHPSGDVVIAGYAESVVDDSDVLVMRVPFGGDAPTWVQTHDGPGSG
jgi:cysteine-rich repeat protein